MCRLLAPAYDDVTITIRGEAIMATAKNIPMTGITSNKAEQNNKIEAVKMTISNNIDSIAQTASRSS